MRVGVCSCECMRCDVSGVCVCVAVCVSSYTTSKDCAISGPVVVVQVAALVLCVWGKGWDLLATGGHSSLEVVLLSSAAVAAAAAAAAGCLANDALVLHASSCGLAAGCTVVVAAAAAVRQLSAFDSLLRQQQSQCQTCVFCWGPQVV